MIQPSKPDLVVDQSDPLPAAKPDFVVNQSDPLPIQAATCGGPGQ